MTLLSAKEILVLHGATDLLMIYGEHNRSKKIYDEH